MQDFSYRQFYFIIVCGDSVIINNDLLGRRQAKINDKNRRLGVFMTPLSR